MGVFISQVLGDINKLAAAPPALSAFSSRNVASKCIFLAANSAE